MEFPESIEIRRACLDFRSVLFARDRWRHTFQSLARSDENMQALSVKHFFRPGLLSADSASNTSLSWDPLTYMLSTSYCRTRLAFIGIASE